MPVLVAGGDSDTAYQRDLRIFSLCSFGWFRFWFRGFIVNLLSGGSMVQHGIRLSGGWGGWCTHFTSPCVLHSDQNLLSLPLCRSDQTVHTLTVHTLWPIHCGSGGRGNVVAIYLRGYPLVICGMGEGGAYLDQVRNAHFLNARVFPIKSRNYLWYSLPNS